MTWIALKMLLGDRGKYLGIIVGITFASLLIAQQATIFCGLMLRTNAQIRDVQGAQIWVMDPNVRFMGDSKFLSDNAPYRVRGVAGVEWAVRLHMGRTRARLQEGNYQVVVMMGVDDGTLIGAPKEMTVGAVTDLRQPDAIIVDEAGYEILWPGEPYGTGKVFEMNDRRAVVVGVCKSSKTFETAPIIYARFNQAMIFVPPEREVVSFVLAQAGPAVEPREVCRRIQAQTGLRALTREDFAWVTILYFLFHTAIPLNFAITVMLGFLVGTAIAGQTFYMFTVENLRQFGILKAMGTSNPRLVGMILLQAGAVGLIGYGLGIGLAAIFGTVVKDMAKIAYFMPWQVLVGTGAAVVFMLLASSILSIRRVLVLEPATVFQG